MPFAPRCPNRWCPIRRTRCSTNGSACPNSSGFGDYTEIGVVIPCSFEGKPASFVSQMYLDDEAPIAAGREIWGFPKKFANPKLEVVSDTLTGTLDYAGQRVATGSMAYKHENLSRHPAKTAASIRKLQVLLKLIPDVDGKPKIAQLVGLHHHRGHGEGLVVGPGAAAPCAARQCAGGRPAGAQGAGRAAFCGRSHPAGRPCAGRLHEELNGARLGRAGAVR